MAQQNGSQATFWFNMRYQITQTKKEKKLNPAKRSNKEKHQSQLSAELVGEQGNFFWYVREPDIKMQKYASSA